MPIRIRLQYPSGYHLGYSIERLADGLYYDFAGAAFSGFPAMLIRPLPESPAPFSGRYAETFAPTPLTVFPDGDYTVTVHDAEANNLVVTELGLTMHAGDDATVIPPPWPQTWTVELPVTAKPG